MKTKVLLLLVLLNFSFSIAQVGINTTAPDASSELDITSTDGGILIPRMTQVQRDVITAPATGLLIYQTNNTPGFYYYNGSAWVNIAGVSDADWFIAGSTNIPTNITDDIITLGNVTMGNSLTGGTSKLNVYSNDATSSTVRLDNSGAIGLEKKAIEITSGSLTGTNSERYIGVLSWHTSNSAFSQTGFKSDFNNLSSAGYYYGVNNDFQAGGTNGYQRGVSNYFGGGEAAFGVESLFPGAFTYSGTTYGVYNSLQSQGNGQKYGTFNNIAGTGSGTKYGTYNKILNTSGGLHYGVYSDVEKATGYAGYFIGRTSLGTSPSSGRYLMPAADGTAGQVIATDGAGNLSFQNATVDTDTDDQFLDDFSLTGNILNLSLDGDGVPTQQLDLSLFMDNTDDQTIDSFALIGTDLHLSLEDDGQPTQIADLSSLNSDDQTIDTFSLVGTTLNLSLEDDGQPNQTVDLSSLQDGTGSDDQAIDAFSLIGTTLNLSLEDDGQPNQTVDLSSLQDGTGTDDQTIDIFSLVGTTLNLSLEDDGQPNQTVDLSSLQDGTGSDDQTIDSFSFNTSTNILTLEIENDGIIPQTVDLSSLSNTDADWLVNPTNAIPTSNSDDIYTLGNVSIGSTNNNGDLTIYHSTSNDGVADNLIYNFLAGSASDAKTMIYNNMAATGSGDRTGLYNVMIGNGSGVYKGIVNYTYASVSGDIYGIHNSFTGTGGGDHYGSYSYLSSTGPGSKYGTYNHILATAGGTHYGIYSDVQKATGYAAYLIGRTSLGIGASNRYIMPGADGSSGQFMTTDGAGNLSWSSVTGESTMANNGLSLSGANVQLGGTLIQNTTIAQNAFTLDINLNNTGDFAIQDNGTDVFFVEDTGDIGIGTSNPAYPLHVVEAVNATTYGVYIDKTDNTTAETSGIFIEKTGSGTGRSHAIYTDVTGTGTGQKYGIFNNITSNANGNQYGVRNYINGNTSGYIFGTFNNLDNAGTGNQYGVYNGMRGTAAANLYGVYNEYNSASIANETVGVRNRFSDGSTGTNGMMGMYTDFTNNANGTYYGVRNEYTSGATGTGAKYGSYNLISTSAGGTHYGTYNEVNASNGWAGYFVGKNYISLGLGINNPNPDGRLDIIHNSTGAGSPHIMITAQNANTGSRIVFDNEAETTNNWVMFARADDTPADSRFNIFHNGTGNIMVVTGDGKVGINRTPTTNDLEVNGNASKATAGGFIANSDKRLKKNIEGIQGKTALEKILKMRGVTYLWDDTQTGIKRPDNLQYGFIAQELMEVFPEKVTKDNLGFYQTAYGDYDPIFVEAIKELKDEIDVLTIENKKLKESLKKYEELEARLSALENNLPNREPMVASKD